MNNNRKKLKIITDNNIYYKVLKEKKKEKTTINTYLKEIFLNKIIVVDCTFENLEEHIKLINEIGIRINYITTSVNLKRDNIDLNPINNFVSSIEKHLEHILEYEIIKLDENLFNISEKENTKKDKILRFRVTEEEYKRINKKAEELNFYKLNDFFNSVLRNKIHLKINKKNLMALIFEIQKIKTNLYQIKKFNKDLNLKNFLKLNYELDLRIKEYINLY